MLDALFFRKLGVRVHFLSFIGSDPQFPEGNSNVTVCSNAEPLPRVATNANPRQLPMNRSVTLPADGGGVSRQAGIGIETPPQASRRRSRLGSSTAVASLARHVICAVAARSSHAPAHAAPVQPLPWECRRPPVGSSPCHQSLRSFSLRSCQPQPQTLPLRSRAG